MPNSLAYYDTATFTGVISVIIQTRGACPRVEHHKCASLGLALAFVRNKYQPVRKLSETSTVILI